MPLASRAEEAILRIAKQGSMEAGGIARALAEDGGGARPGTMLALGALALAVLADSHPLPERGLERDRLPSHLGPDSVLAEYSGARLLMCELGLDLRRLLLFTLVVNLALPWGLAEALSPWALAAAAALLALKLMTAAALAALAAAGLGKASVTPQLVAVALTLAALAAALVVVGGEVRV